MTLPNPPDRYTPSTEGARNREIEQADAQNYKRDRDVLIVGNRLVLRSPDGTLFQIEVSNAGALSATAL